MFDCNHDNIFNVPSYFVALFFLFMDNNFFAHNYIASNISIRSKLFQRSCVVSIIHI